MTQKERVLERLKNGGWLPMPGTPRRSPSTRHLEARVGDLRPDGHSITERRVAAKFYSEYRLVLAPAPVIPPASQEAPREPTTVTTSIFLDGLPEL
jgi:hypothetical protein